MLVKAQRFSFTEVNKSLGAASSLPYLPLTLSHRSTSLPVSGLLDTGATINVLPYNVGRQLGVVWDQQTTLVHLTGNLPVRGTSIGCFRNGGGICAGAPCVCLDTSKQCPSDFGTSEFLSRVRCVFLPVSKDIRGQAQRASTTPTLVMRARLRSPGRATAPAQIQNPT